MNKVWIAIWVVQVVGIIVNLAAYYLPPRGGAFNMFCAGLLAGMLVAEMAKELK